MTARAPFPVFLPLGEGAILIRLGDRMDRALNRRVRQLAEAIAGHAIEGVTDTVPAYASLAVHYDPRKLEYATLEKLARDIVAAHVLQDAVPGTDDIVVIPVAYDGEDLEEVARLTGLPRAEIVARHAGVEYVVYMMGFAPGFAYMGDLDPALHVPRRPSPRTRVPRGAVAIAGSQTAVYPLATPGGWQLIGRTEVVLFDPNREPPSLLRTGARVKFEPAR